MSALLGASALAVAASALPTVRAADPQAALNDPTRPPSVRAGTRESAAALEAAPRLQSILISPQRRLAVIDGRTVPLGGRIGEATLVQVAETHVTLKQGNELKTLELTPGVAKTGDKPR